MAHGDAHQEPAIHGVGSIVERQALRKAVKNLKAGNRKYNLTRKLGAEALTHWPIAKWEVESEYVPTRFARIIGESKKAKNRLDDHEVSNLRRMIRLAMWYEMGGLDDEIAGLVPEELQVPWNHSSYDRDTSLEVITRKELEVRILHDLTMPILLHFIDTDDFVAEGLDLLTQSSRNTFYEVMVNRWPILVGWMFEELIGDMIESKFIWSRNIVTRLELPTLRKKCRELLRKRFFLYIDSAMLHCVAHAVTDATQGFFKNEAGFYSDVTRQNTFSGMAAVLPKLAELPVAWSAPTHRRHSPWSKKNLRTIGELNARNAANPNASSHIAAGFATIYGAPQPWVAASPQQASTAQIQQQTLQLQQENERLQQEINRQAQVQLQQPYQLGSVLSPPPRTTGPTSPGPASSPQLAREQASTAPAKNSAKKTLFGQTTTKRARAQSTSPPPDRSAKKRQ